jgi:hypothetical protein
MSSKLHAPETDLIIPLPGPGDAWDPHTIHTHYFGLTVPEAAIGVFVYIRYMPYFPLCQGGILIYQGMDNLATTDMAFHDYEITMPWPEIEGNRITTANGLTVEFPEPGRRAQVRYTSTDGRTRLDVEATAVTPLAARGHVVPGEELHTSQEAGGTEQFMHYTGELVVHGERHAVDCHMPRDRSWRQVRSESRDANLHPPVTWTPIWFGEDLAFNQVGIEEPDTDPDYAGVYEIPAGAPTHHFAWVSVNGEVREITRVRRNVLKTHPQLFAPLKLEIDAEDETGEQYHVRGEAIAFTPIMMWPNISAFDSIYRWQDGQGRVAYGTVQTMHVEAYAHAMKAKHQR